MENKKYPKYETDLVDIYECKNCGKEILQHPHGFCCHDQDLVYKGKDWRKVFKAKPDYDEIVSKMDKRDWFHVTH